MSSSSSSSSPSWSHLVVLRALADAAALSRLGRAKLHAKCIGQARKEGQKQADAVIAIGR
jgi:hypothetical protein